MNYKPDKATLTSFIYGELSKEEQEKVKTYLADHPELKKEVEEIRSLQKFMGGFQDKEVVEPLFVLDDTPRIIVSGNRKLDGFVKGTLAIAASIAVLILVGYFTSFSISTSAGGFHVSFGSFSPQEQPTAELNEESIKSWMQETLEASNENLINKINGVEYDLEAQSRQLTALRTVDKQSVNKMDEELLDSYVSQIKQENRDIIVNLLEVAGRDQKLYIDELMRDFANYVETKRQNDLKVIQAHLNSLANSGLNQLEDLHNSD